MGTRNALLFRSRDGGESWTQLPFPAQVRAFLNTLAIDPEGKGIYLAGLTSELAGYSGILRSTDAGATWRQAPDLRNQQVRAIAFKRANSNLVAAGTDSGVYLSQDSGLTWKRISPVENGQLRPIVAVAFDPNDSSTIYAGTPHLPWRTWDGGATWRSIHYGMINDSDVFSIQPDRNRPQRVFAGACSGIYRSLSGGATWARPAAKDASYRTYIIVQDPQYENVWYAGTTHGTIRSLDGGSTWEELCPFAARSIAFDPGSLGRILIVTDEEGIVASDDRGKTWRAQNRGFCNRRLSSIWTTANAVYTIASDSTGNGSILRLGGGLNEWEVVGPAAELPFPPWSASHKSARARPAFYVGDYAVRNWYRLGLPLPGSHIRALMTVDQSWFAAVGTEGTFLSKDGQNWIPGSSAMGEVYDVTSTLGGRLLAATASGVKKSDDLGRTWHSVAAGDLGNDTVQSICSHPLRTRELFAAKYGTIYASSDAGGSWTRISMQPETMGPLRHLVVLPGTPDRLLVLTQQAGVWALPLERDNSARGRGR